MPIKLWIASLGLLLCAAANAQSSSAPLRIGVLPTYDSSGENFTETLPVNLSYLTYFELLKSPSIQPVLLAPGGLYEPASTSFVAEYARRVGVDKVLIINMLPTRPVGKTHRNLSVEAQMLDVTTGSLSDKLVNNDVSVASVDLQTVLVAVFGGLFSSQRDYVNTPLGKSTLKLAQWLAAFAANAPGASGSGPAATSTSGGPACSMNLRIHYTSKRTSSKSYQIFINDKDETPAVKDGVATFTMAAGPLAMRFNTQDPPYALPTEKLYQISTIHDCTSPNHTAVIDIGAAGEALIHWEP